MNGILNYYNLGCKMKIEMVDHDTMEIISESVADHFFLCQFHNGLVRLRMPKPFEFNACKLEIKTAPDLQEMSIPETKKEANPELERQLGV